MLVKLDKSAILKKLIFGLESDLAHSEKAAEAARDAAINEESKSEDKHDTRSIEAGYLAGAQRKRVSEIKELINFFKILRPEAFSKKDPVSSNALVELELEDQTLYYFLLARGGGLKVEIEGHQIQTITPQTPLGESLLGMKVGDVVVVESKKSNREYEITAIA
jgi:transcription elongation GreA/GreB family factor